LKQKGKKKYENNFLEAQLIKTWRLAANQLFEVNMP
jgi:hypothetical protein